MKNKFNQIIINLLCSFINNNNLSYNRTSQIRKYTFYQKPYPFTPSHTMSNNSECIKDILLFNIFEPISNFNYGNGNLYLVTFTELLNVDLFNIFKNEFINTQYEDLFFSSINKIIPINYCIQNQPWDIVQKMLITKKLQSNGLPDIENSKLFFENLITHVYEKDFNQSLFTFCTLNKSFIKRLECQQYLKNLLKKISDNTAFNIFIKEDTSVFITTNNDYITCRIYKPFLFNKFTDLVRDKKEPITKLVHLLNLLKSNILTDSKIKNLFVLQEEEKFKELIIFIHFNESIHYSFEDYLMFLLDVYLKNKMTSPIELKKVSDFYFLNNKLAVKNITQKTTKI